MFNKCIHKKNILLFNEDAWQSDISTRLAKILGLGGMFGAIFCNSSALKAQEKLNF